MTRDSYDRIINSIPSTIVPYELVQSLCKRRSLLGSMSSPRTTFILKVWSQFGKTYVSQDVGPCQRKKCDTKSSTRLVEVDLKFENCTVDTH